MKTKEANSMSKSKATWIWYPGDFEIWLGNIFNNRRTERGAMFPPFWKQDSHYVTVEFSRTFTLDKEETITIACEGQFNFMLDGQLQYGQPHTFVVPKGKHKLNIKVWNQATPPSLFIQGDAINTDSSWLTTYEDKIWIDENGVAHGSGIYVPAASWHFNRIDTPISAFRLLCEEQHPCTTEKLVHGTLYDFGKETFGYLYVQTQGKADSEGVIHVYYGESSEEATDKEHCETLDHFSPDTHQSPSVRRLESKAFRYVYIESEGDVSIDKVWMDYEYAPHDASHSGSFNCSDEELNNIWNVAAYTLDLTTREFFMDGIKRDRWTWSGDAIQSYLMNYYLRFDTDCVKRTIRQLRGKDPVTTHVNTIMDYTFYWFKSILDYYRFTGDKDFIREMWPLMVSLMEYVLGRTNSDGMAEGKSDDWIFVDWTDFPMHKRGILCFEQILFCQALKVMDECARIIAPAENLRDYAALADKLQQHIRENFWSNEQHAFLHAIEDGVMNPQITKFPNMFAILYGLTDAYEQTQIMQHVVLNPKVPAITTPYMRFYELEALCMAGLHTEVLNEMKAYWGGMLREGATTFWEKYNPQESGREHLAMYGRPYGKSLCHAWGASPIYMIGRYFLGVEPTMPGYEEYEVRPVLSNLEWMEGDVPTPFGKISIQMNRETITILSNGGRGKLFVSGNQYDIKANEPLVVNY